MRLRLCLNEIETLSQLGYYAGCPLLRTLVGMENTGIFLATRVYILCLDRDRTSPLFSVLYADPGP
jgi:hypothetical protein